jgi:hypothetical protein
MTTHQGFKGRFVLLLEEGLQQLPIRPARPLLPQYGAA